MKKLFTLVIALFLLSMYSNAAQIIAGDLRWECLGNDSFAFILEIYTDCNGPDLDTVAINIAGCSNMQVLQLQRLTEEDVTPVCEHMCTRCGDPSCTFPYGIKKVVFFAKAVLSNSCPDYNISWSHCCYSPIISTAPQNQGFYLAAKMYRSSAPCNSSPRFSTAPFTLQCAGQCFVYNQGSSDAEGDSLVFSLAPPLVAENTPFQYSSPYSYDKPLQFFGFPVPIPDKQCRGFFMDSIYGDLFFRPQQPQVTVTAIKIEEYRNGSKISEVTRNVNFIITNCPPNNYPILSGINGGKDFTATAQPGQQLSFTINSDDDDNTDTVEVDWNGGIPGATFTVGIGRTPTATFNWTPKPNDVSVVPYFFTVKATDDACPKPGTTVRSYRIVVSDKTGVGQGFNTINFSLQPNPATGQVEVFFEDMENGRYDLVITDLSGRILDIQKVIANRHNLVNRKGLANGLYFISIYKEDQRLVTRKLIWN